MVRVSRCSWCIRVCTVSISISQPCCTTASLTPRRAQLSLSKDMHTMPVQRPARCKLKKIAQNSPEVHYYYRYYSTPDRVSDPKNIKNMNLLC